MVSFSLSDVIPSPYRHQIKVLKKNTSSLTSCLRSYKNNGVVNIKVFFTIKELQSFITYYYMLIKSLIKKNMYWTY